MMENSSLPPSLESTKETKKHRDNHAAQRDISAQFFFSLVLVAILPLIVGMGVVVFAYEMLLTDTFTAFAGQKDLELFLFLENRLNGLHVEMAFIMVAFGIIAFAGLWFTNRSFARPIKNFLDVMEKVSRGNFSVSLPRIPGEQSGELSQKFSDMIENLKEARRRERALLQAKNEFIRIAGHQLRTPLSALKWSFDMLLQEEAGALTPTQKNVLQKGYEANDSMLHIVNDLLSVADIEEGRFGYQFESVDVAALIRGIVGEFRALAEKRGIRLDFFSPSQALPALWADKSRIGMVLANFISNALTYTKSGGSVLVTLQNEKDAVTVSVQDTGIGIPQSEQHYIFDKFFRGKEASAMQPDGTGMGLFIAKNIVERHGGTILFHSKEGEGTVLSFHIPWHRKEKTSPEGFVPEMPAGT